MAISYTAQRKSAELLTQTSTSTFSPTTTLAAGSLGVLVVLANNNKTITSVTDNVGGNTWRVDMSQGDGARTVSFVSCNVATQVTSGGTFTINWAVSTSGSVAYWLLEVAGAATSSAFDKSSFNSGTGSVPITTSTGSTGALTQADEIAIAASLINSSSATWAKDAAFSSPSTTDQGTAFRTSTQYKVAAATTALNAGGTWSTAGTLWVAGIATYKGVAAAAGSTNQPGFRFGFR